MKFLAHTFENLRISTFFSIIVQIDQISLIFEWKNPKNGRIFPKNDQIPMEDGPIN